MSSKANTHEADIENNYSVKIIKDIQSTHYINSIDKFLSQSPYAHPKQSISWALSKSECSHYFIVLTLKNNNIHAYSLVCEHRSKLPGLSKFVVDGGPVVHKLDVLPMHLEHLTEALSLNAAWLKIRPYFLGNNIDIAHKYLNQKQFVSRNTESSSYLSTINIALERPIDEIKADFRRSLKTQLNKAIKSGIEAEICNSEKIFLEFIKAYNQYAKTNNFGYIDQHEGLNIFNRFCKDSQSGCFIVISGNQRLLGGIVLLAAGDRVFFEWGFSSHEAEHRKLPLGHALQMKAINWAKEKNFKVYDLGGYWIERGDNDPINRFKTGFSKNILPVLPEHIYEISPIRCSVARTLGRIKTMFTQP